MADAEIRAALERMGLLRPGEPARFRPLAGGVSSDIRRVEVGDRRFCVKRALPRLRVAADWRAPVERNRFEAAWMRTVAAILPDAVPELLGEDREAGLFAMAWLDPARFPLWKAELMAGRIDPEVGAAVGAALARIHRESAGRTDIARRFASDRLFHALRLEPYLEATARAHPAVADRLLRLAEITAATRRALVHGDVSPKNILLGPAGPVFLDAECAWYGDPAFDLAFCLNHLLLKAVHRPDRLLPLLACFEALLHAHAAGLDRIAAEETAARTAALLPALLLARIDGKSPVEYLDREEQRDFVRGIAIRLLREPQARAEAIAALWRRELAA